MIDMGMKMNLAYQQDPKLNLIQFDWQIWDITGYGHAWLPNGLTVASCSSSCALS
ncbi:hypothetical protein GYMLUDRAFT_682628 [Collybiopsis luxurians FD-317 M1]|uniref:Uncharacterized protein n=1 Tax=Collybiopsis luxurians FD-317 M1 TaxID=944289 RepID=A0A0D0CTM7_9AGAR|nr:hypothetical protein GYMLUDRAFT_682628 [Collybiopsis luxurians FD-317 M1]